MSARTATAETETPTPAVLHAGRAGRVLPAMRVAHRINSTYLWYRCSSFAPLGAPRNPPNRSADGGKRLSPAWLNNTVRIGIDARKLHDFGIGTYIRNLLKQLARVDQDTEYVLLCRPQDTAV